MQLILPTPTKPGFKSLCLIKIILEALEREEFHKLRSQYIKNNKEPIGTLALESEAANRGCWFERHVYAALREKWIRKVWEFDVPYKLPSWAMFPSTGARYRFVYELTHSGSRLLNKLRKPRIWQDVIEEEQSCVYFKNLDIH